MTKPLSWILFFFFNKTQIQFEQLTQEQSVWLLGDRDMVGEGWETEPGCVWGAGPSCFDYHDIKPQWKCQFHAGPIPPIAIWCTSVLREHFWACGKVPHASPPVNRNKGALIRSVVLAGGFMCQEKKAQCSAEIQPPFQCVHQYVWTRRKSNSTFKEHNTGFGARLPWKMQPSKPSHVWIHHWTLSHSTAASCDSKCHQVWGGFWKRMCSVCLRLPLLMEPEREQLETNGSAWLTGYIDSGISSCKYYWLEWKFPKLGTSLI